MRSSNVLITTICLIGVYSQACAETIVQPLSEIGQYADALNIEGGLLSQRCLRKNQIWANLCFVLDRPFDNGVELKDITKRNIYPLKEANILSYNERRAALATAAVLKYYITHSHEVASLSDQNQAHLVVQVHRNTTGPTHVDFLRRLVGLMGFDTQDKRSAETDAQFVVFSEHKVLMELRYGVPPTSYENAHIVLSISLAAGLNPEWESGTVMVPHQFVPFDLHNMALMKSLSFRVDNHLLEVLEMVVAMQDRQLLDAVNHRYASVNPNKNLEKVSFLKIEDFHPACLLQANGIFNPSMLPKNLAVLK